MFGPSPKQLIDHRYVGVRTCTVEYNESDFFLENKEYRPLMGAKLKSETHLQNTFFDFFEPFFVRLASKFEKVQIWTLKIFF